MPGHPKEYLLAIFGPNRWTGAPARDAGSLFVGAGFLTFLASLFLSIFIEPLRSIPVVILLCTLVATVWMVADIVSRAKREKSFLTGLTAQVNGAILEITGDPGTRLTVRQLRDLIEDGPGRQLLINGVPGVELKAEGKILERKRILAVVTPPDYGLESFDVLLTAERQRKSR